MPKSIISEGKTSTEAIENGLKKLNLSKNEVDIKIIEEKKKSFFNILTPHVVKVELTVKENKKNSDNNENNISENEMNFVKEKIENFLNEFLSKILKEINFTINEVEDNLDINIEGKEATKLIGYRGEALNSLQTILMQIANQKSEKKIKVNLNIGNYKETRKKTLEDLAMKMEKIVIKTGKSITLEPMIPYERKIIHTCLQDSKSVKTYSVGEQDKRRVVITKK